jgi:hypothetical protein
VSGWLDPLRRRLDASHEPATVFFRDDDAGWRDDRLLALLDQFARYSVAIDLAVIPAALDRALARRLHQALTDGDGRVAVHQHGFVHVNHEPAGRKWEFGPARTKDAQHRDIELGRQRLHELMGPVVQPMFTPPWNRCTRDTARCLLDLGFDVLSRDVGAVPFDAPGLIELPIHLDWQAQRHGVRLTLAEWGAALATALGRPEPVGIMLHHAVLDEEELELLRQLLAVLAAHDRVRSAAMIEVARAQAAPAGVGDRSRDAACPADALGAREVLPGSTEVIATSFARDAANQSRSRS